MHYQHLTLTLVLFSFNEKHALDQIKHLFYLHSK